MIRKRSRTRKVTVPSPLPSRRGKVQLPPQLIENIESALGVRARETLRKTMSDTLEAEGWTERLRAYLRDAIMNADGEVDDEELSIRVMRNLSPCKDNEGSANEESALVEAELWPGEMQAREQLQIPQRCVDVTVDFLKKELEPVCDLVDAVDWDG